jgi:xylan 1,4-beta-xylosidase
MEEYSIDEVNSNAYTLWKKMGSPQQVRPSQYADLENAAKLKLINKKSVKINTGLSSINIQMPRQSVKLFKISW